jgi:hypothetical protein
MARNDVVDFERLLTVVIIAGLAHAEAACLIDANVGTHVGLRVSLLCHQTHSREAFEIQCRA